MFNDRLALITGGTGSLNKQYIKTLLERYQPANLIIYSLTGPQGHRLAGEAMGNFNVKNIANGTRAT